MIHPSLAHLVVELDSVVHDPDNARIHSPRNIDAIAGSLTAYGQRKPIVVQREGMVVRAGNGTVEAARRLGWPQIAAVIVDEADITAAAYGLADNRTAELASWDDIVLSRLLRRIIDEGSDTGLFELTGFDEAAASRLQSALDGAADFAGLASEGALPLEAPPGEQATHLPVYTRMVQLFLPDAEAHAAFMADLRTVAAHHGCATATDSAQAAVAAQLAVHDDRN